MGRWHGNEGLLHGRAGGVSVLLDGRGPALPVIVHWGADLGTDVDVTEVLRAVEPAISQSALDVRVPLSILPERARGYRGRPGLTGHRDGVDWSPSFGLIGIEHTDEDTLVVHAEDATVQLRLRSELQLTAQGLLRVRHALRNTGSEPYLLSELLAVLPLPSRARELLDLTGRWSRERQPQRRAFDIGTWLRETRRGRTGHDASLILAAGTPHFTFRSGEVWAVHLGWSADTAVLAERALEGQAVLGAAEALGPGEVILGADEEYTGPCLSAAYSAQGLDGISDVFHGWLRARPQHPARPRPVTLNTWEAVYFDHDLDRLRTLADTAARVGVERFVLDDGWFRHRRDDTAGLGDWYVAEDVWPEGLHPLIDHVRGLGMEFGLWFEPEMVNPDSDLYRAHPDWVLHVDDRLPPAWRHQQVLDLVNPDAFAYLLERIDALLTEYEIAYVKWDHNRDLIEAGHRGRPAVHRQTLALYALLDEIRSRHPDVEIESCSSGGARVDLGILERTERVWASDSNDALERQGIQRWTSLLLAPELIGAHIGPPTAHTTGRTHRLSFRAATALFAHLGIEWDITAASEAELQALSATIHLHKSLRTLLHRGTVVRGDHPEAAGWLHGVVAPDGGEALYAYLQMAMGETERPAEVALPGLEPDRRYRVRPIHPAGEPRVRGSEPPRWYADGAVTLPGRVLATTGLALPVLDPEEALLLHVVEER
jgi:alpha-galactosidase